MGGEAVRVSGEGRGCLRLPRWGGRRVLRWREIAVRLRWATLGFLGMLGVWYERVEEERAYKTLMVDRARMSVLQLPMSPQKN